MPSASCANQQAQTRRYFFRSDIIMRQFGTHCCMQKFIAVEPTHFFSRQNCSHDVIFCAKAGIDPHSKPIVTASTVAFNISPSSSFKRQQSSASCASPSRPNAPRPVAKRGSAAGSGVSLDISGATRWSCANWSGVPSKKEPFTSPTSVPRSAIVMTLVPPLSSMFVSPRNWRTVKPLSGAWAPLRLARMRSPNRRPEVPGSNPASEKSTLNSSPSVSPPKPPDAVEIGFNSFPLSGANVPIEGIYASTDVASVKDIVKPLNEPTVTPNVAP